MSPRSTLVFAALAALAAGGVWFDGRLRGDPHLLPRAPLPTPDTPALLDAAATVARLEWERGGERLTLMRSANGWSDAAGHAWPADVVESALDTLASLRPHVVAPADEVDLAAFGLAATRERLRVLDDGGRMLLAIDIGNRNPAWTGWYVRRDGADDVLLVGALLRWELDKLHSADSGIKQP